MILRQVILKNFRNFQDQSFDFSPSLTVIIGNNSRGKTNLLESVYFIINGVGFREEKEEELINLDKKQLSVDGLLEDDKEKNSFRITIMKKDDKVLKTFYVNKTVKKYAFYQKELSGVVLFTPEQIYIIIGPPSERRGYFNKLLSNFDNEYKKHLNNFESAIRRRNKILEKHYSPEGLIEELKFWNDYLEKEAGYITKTRQIYVDFLNSNQSLDSKKFSIVYLKNEFNKKRLEQVFDKERLIRRTMIGPQKDDFQIVIDNNHSSKDVHHFGSRSEERLSVFWLKINELKYFELKKRKPILLLDDIFSELDEKNQEIIFPLVKEYQTIATMTEVKIVDSIKIPKKIIRL